MDGGIVAVFVTVGLVYGSALAVIISECYSNKIKSKYNKIGNKIKCKYSKIKNKYCKIDNKKEQK